VKHCRTCNWFVRIRGTKWGICESPKVRLMSWKEREPPPGELRIVDPADEGLEIHVSETFGCTCHEPV